MNGGAPRDALPVVRSLSSQNLDFARSPRFAIIGLSLCSRSGYPWPPVRWFPKRGGPSRPIQVALEALMPLAATTNSWILASSPITLALVVGLGLLGCGSGSGEPAAQAGGGTSGLGGTAAGAAGDVGSTGGSSTSGSSGESGGSSTSGSSHAAGGGGSSTIQSDSGSGPKEPTRPTQETYRGSPSVDCVSPFQKQSLITASDAPRCDCEPSTATCVDGMQFICDRNGWRTSRCFRCWPARSGSRA